MGLSQDAIDIMLASIMLYSTIIALIVKLIFPDEEGLELNIEMSKDTGGPDRGSRVEQEQTQ